LSATGTKTGTKDVGIGLKFVGLIQSSIRVNLFANAAFREVAAAEWFRQDLG
jgi:hypothetical protein